MKILWVNFGGLLPLDMGGKIRSFHIVRELAKRHEVTLFTFYPKMLPDPHHRLGAPFERVELLPLDLPEVASFPDMIAYAANVLSLRPYQMTRHCPPQVGRLLRQLLQERRYDMVVCDFLLTASVMHWESGIPTVIFAHNVDGIIWRRRFLVDRRPLWRLVALREWWAMARAERYYGKLANHVLTVSEEDRRAFAEYLPSRKSPQFRLELTSNIFVPCKWSHNATGWYSPAPWTGCPMRTQSSTFTLKFSLSSENVSRCETASGWEKPVERILALKEMDAGLEVTGTVDDIRPYVRDAAVYVVPLRIGGGTRIKIFEAMAMGMAVVSTAVGAEGLPVEHGKNILLADTPASFAEATVTLLTQAACRQRIGSAARALVEERYGWSAVTDVVDETLKQVAAARCSANVETPQLDFA